MKSRGFPWAKEVPNWVWNSICDPCLFENRLQRRLQNFFERCRKAYLKSSSQNDAIIFFIHDFTLSGKKTRSKESNRTWNFTIRKAEHRRSRVTLLRLLKYHHIVALIGSKARTNLNGAQMNPWNWGSSK